MLKTTLPDEVRVLAEMAAAEKRAGWLAACAETGRYVCATSKLVEALAGVFEQFGPGPVLEVAAGDGFLARALNGSGVKVVATDCDPPPGVGVVCLSAEEAVRRYRPRVVLGCFVPAGSRIDQTVLSAPTVEHYLILNARLGGQCGDRSLWSTAGWTSIPLPEVAAHLITRHDVWLAPDRPILRHGEAWHFRRTASP